MMMMMMMIAFQDNDKDAPLGGETGDRKSLVFPKIQI